MLVPIVLVKGEKARHIELVKDLPKIGSKFKGPNHFIDTANGSTWSVLAPLTANELMVQSALLKKEKPRAINKILMDD